jgi:hypothetical protein
VKLLFQGTDSPFGRRAGGAFLFRRPDVQALIVVPPGRKIGEPFQEILLIHADAVVESGQPQDVFQEGKSKRSMFRPDSKKTSSINCEAGESPTLNHGMRVCRSAIKLVPPSSR